MDMRHTGISYHNSYVPGFHFFRVCHANAASLASSVPSQFMRCIQKCAPCCDWQQGIARVNFTSLTERALRLAIKATHSWALPHMCAGSCSPRCLGCTWIAWTVHLRAQAVRDMGSTATGASLWWMLISTLHLWVGFPGWCPTSANACWGAAQPRASAWSRPAFVSDLPLHVCTWYARSASHASFSPITCCTTYSAGNDGKLLPLLKSTSTTKGIPGSPTEAVISSNISASGTPCARVTSCERRFSFAARPASTLPAFLCRLRIALALASSDGPACNEKFLTCQHRRKQDG